MDHKRRHIGWISSSLPNRCGVATFSRDLMAGICDHIEAEFGVLAAQRAEDNYTYTSPVIGTLIESDPDSFVAAADQLNQLFHPDVLVLQHEYGLYGGNRTTFTKGDREVSYPLGDNVFKLLDNTQAPLISTLHTVLPNPDPARRDIIRRIFDRSQFVVTMTHNSARLLRSDYDIDDGKLRIIPHGVPAVEPVDPAKMRRNLGVPADHQALVVTGLIGGNKSIERIIAALPEILQAHPDVVLYVIGQTHPNILAHSGEAYREGLIDQAADLDISDHVKFINRYVGIDELVQWIQTADVYLTLHHDPEQAASGTLAYALGAGVTCVSTPYRYAKEVLADGRGFLVPFEDDTQLASTITNILSNPELERITRAKAAAYGRNMRWTSVGRDYADLIEAVTTSHAIAN